MKNENFNIKLDIQELTGQFDFFLVTLLGETYREKLDSLKINKKLDVPNNINANSADDLAKFQIYMQTYLKKLASIILSLKVSHLDHLDLEQRLSLSILKDILHLLFFLANKPKCWNLSLTPALNINEQFKEYLNKNRVLQENILPNQSDSCISLSECANFDNFITFVLLSVYRLSFKKIPKQKGKLEKPMLVKLFKENLFYYAYSNVTNDLRLSEEAKKDAEKLLEVFFKKLNEFLDNFFNKFVEINSTILLEICADFNDKLIELKKDSSLFLEMQNNFNKYFKIPKDASNDGVINFTIQEVLISLQNITQNIDGNYLEKSNSALKRSPSFSNEHLQRYTLLLKLNNLIIEFTHCLENQNLETNNNVIGETHLLPETLKIFTNVVNTPQFATLKNIIIPNIELNWFTKFSNWLKKSWLWIKEFFGKSIKNDTNLKLTDDSEKFIDKKSNPVISSLENQNLKTHGSNQISENKNFINEASSINTDEVLEKKNDTFSLSDIDQVLGVIESTTTTTTNKELVDDINNDALIPSWLFKPEAANKEQPLEEAQIQKTKIVADQPTTKNVAPNNSL